MARNQKLTRVIKGRTVQSATVEPERLVVVFDDHSTMTVKTVPSLAAEDGSSVTMKLANPGASVAVHARNSAVEYLG